MLQCGRRKIEEASAIALVDDARHSFIQQKLESLVKQAPGGSNAQQFVKIRKQNKVSTSQWELPKSHKTWTLLVRAMIFMNIYDIIYLSDEGVQSDVLFRSYFDTVSGASVTPRSVHWSSCFMFRISPKAARWSRCWQIRKWKRRKRKLSHRRTAHFQRQRQPHCVVSPRCLLFKNYIGSVFVIFFSVQVVFLTVSRLFLFGKFAHKSTSKFSKASDVSATHHAGGSDSLERRSFEDTYRCPREEAEITCSKTENGVSWDCLSEQVQVLLQGRSFLLNQLWSPDWSPDFRMVDPVLCKGRTRWNFDHIETRWP